MKKSLTKTLNHISTSIHKVSASINWRYASGEVFLIFLGINLALWFNNWNEDLKTRRIEKETLREIRNEILLDTIDLNDNLRGYKILTSQDSLIEKYYLQKRPYDDKLGHALLNLSSRFSIIFHYSAYKTLQSRGTEIIQDDSLRNEIIRLYDFDYRSVEIYENKEYSIPDLLYLNNDFFHKHFYLDTLSKSDLVVLKVKDYDRFLEDKAFYFIQKNLMFYRIGRYNRYQRVKAKMLKIAESIEKKLR